MASWHENSAVKGFSQYWKYSHVLTKFLHRQNGSQQAVHGYTQSVFSWLFTTYLAASYRAFSIHDLREQEELYPGGCRSSVSCEARAITIWICRLSSALRWLNSGPRSGPSSFPGCGGGGGMMGRPGTVDFDAAGRDSDNEDDDGVRLWLDEVDPRSREPAGVDVDESGGWPVGVGDGGGLVVAGGGLLSEKNADVMADAVDMTSARGAGVDGRWTGLSPPTIALEMKPEMFEKRFMTAASYLTATRLF